MNAPVSNALAQTIPQRVAVENGQAAFPQASTQVDQAQGMAMLQNLANPTPVNAPSKEEILKLLAANPGLVTPELKAATEAAKKVETPKTNLEQVAAQAALEGKQTVEAAKASDPFSQIASVLTGIFSPFATLIENAVKQFTGIGGEALENAVKSGFNTVEVKQPDIRATLKGLSNQAATSFNSLSQAIEQGKLDVPTKQLAENIVKGMKEFPQAFEAAMKEFPQAFEAAIKTIPIDEAMMTRVLGKVQADIGNNQPKLLAALEQLKKQLPSGNLDMNKIEQVFKDMPTRAELN